MPGKDDYISIVHFILEDMIEYRFIATLGL